MDAGGGSLKIVMNIIKEESEVSSPPFKKGAGGKKPRSCYSDIYGSMFKESGINGKNQFYNQCCIIIIFM